MSIISLFQSTFFSDVFSFKLPGLSLIALVCLVGSGLLQWKLNTAPKKSESKYFQYYLALGLIAAIIIVDLATYFFSKENVYILQRIFGCVVFAIIGMAVSAGIWYLRKKDTKKPEE